MRAALALSFSPVARNIGRARRFCRNCLAQAGHEASRRNVVTATVLVGRYLAGV